MLALAAALVVAACSGDDGDEPAVATTTSTSAASGDVLPFEGGDTELVPGTYANDAFRPAFTFELDEGWRGGHEIPNEFFDVIRPEVTVAFSHPDFVIGAGRERRDVADLDPAGVIDALAANPDVRATPMPPTTIAGQPAPTVELVPNDDVDLLGSPAGELGGVAGRGHRVSAVVLDGELLLVIAIAPEPFAPAYAMAEPVITSIEG